MCPDGLLWLAPILWTIQKEKTATTTMRKQRTDMITLFDLGTVLIILETGPIDLMINFQSV